MLLTRNWYDDSFVSNLFLRDFVELKPSVIVPQYTAQKIDDVYELRIDVPGVKREDLSLKIQNKMLLLEYKRDDIKHKFTCLIPKTYDDENPNASLENGVLTIRFTQKSELKPKDVVVTIK